MMTPQEMETRIHFLEEKMRQLTGTDYDMEGRRFINAGTSVGASDFVTKKELTRLFEQVKVLTDEIQRPAEPALESSKRFPKVKITSKDGIQFYNSTGTLESYINEDGIFTGAATISTLLTIEGSIAMVDGAFIEYTGSGAESVGIVFEGTLTRELQFEIDSGQIGKFTVGGLTLNGWLDIEDDYIEMDEMTAPSAPAGNGVRIFAVDNGAGKTQLQALFASGVAQVIATEP